MRNIVMLGVQGSGKGTQADRISDRYDIPTISTGKLFRAEIERNTGFGREISSFMAKGDLVPNLLINQVMGERLSEEDTTNGVIVDGFPRTLDQAKVLDDIMSAQDRKVTHVLYINFSDDEAVRLLSGRRVCSNPKCEASYHVEFNPPQKDPDLCDRCGSKLIQRADDNPDAIRRRLELYHKDTAPLVDFYRKRGILFEVDGAQPIPQVEEVIKSALA